MSAYLTIKELSEKSQFSVSQLRRLVRAGRIPFYQPGGKGGKLRFPPDAIERSVDISQDCEAERKPDAQPLPGRSPRWMENQS